MATRYMIRIPDDAARGEFGFHSQGAAALATELQEALRGDALFARWRDAQEDPDQVDPALGVTDPAAQVRGDQHETFAELVAVTSIPGSVLRHRLRLLAGSAWELRDVRSA